MSGTVVLSFFFGMSIGTILTYAVIEFVKLVKRARKESEENSEWLKKKLGKDYPEFIRRLGFA